MGSLQSSPPFLRDICRSYHHKVCINFEVNESLQHHSGCDIELIVAWCAHIQHGRICIHLWWGICCLQWHQYTWHHQKDHCHHNKNSSLELKAPRLLCISPYLPWRWWWWWWSSWDVYYALVDGLHGYRVFSEQWCQCFLVQPVVACFHNRVTGGHWAATAICCSSPQTLEEKTFTQLAVGLVMLNGRHQPVLPSSWRDACRTGGLVRRVHKVMDLNQKPNCEEGS